MRKQSNPVPSSQKPQHRQSNPAPSHKPQQRQSNPQGSQAPEKKTRAEGPLAGNVTFTTFIMTEQWKIPNAKGKFTQLLVSLQTGLKAISGAVRTIPSTNLTPEQMKDLEKSTKELLTKILKSSHQVMAIVYNQPEDNEVIQVEETSKGKYVVCCTILDGMEEYESFVALGTIFSIYKPANKQPGEGFTTKDLLVAGKDIVCAGYLLHGASTAFVLAHGTGLGTTFFRLDTTIGEFMMCNTRYTIPKNGNSVCIDVGFGSFWDKSITEFMHRRNDPKFNQNVSVLYFGINTADFHKTLCKGGITLCPFNKNINTYKTKLIFNCFPLSFIVTEAGGLSTNGKQEMLKVVPTDVNELSNLFLGSPDEMMELMSSYGVNH